MATAGMAIANERHRSFCLKKKNQIRKVCSEMVMSSVRTGGS